MLSVQQLSILQELADGNDHPINRHRHRALTNLLNDGYVEEVGDGIWCITIEGREAHAAAMAATAEPKPPRIPKRKGITLPEPAPQPRFNIAPMPKPDDFYDPKPAAISPSKAVVGDFAPSLKSERGLGGEVGVSAAFDIHIAQPDRDYSILQLEILRGINRD